MKILQQHRLQAGERKTVMMMMMMIIRMMIMMMMIVIMKVCAMLAQLVRSLDPVVQRRDKFIPGIMLTHG